MLVPVLRGEIPYRVEPFSSNRAYGTGTNRLAIGSPAIVYVSPPGKAPNLLSLRKMPVGWNGKTPNCAARVGCCRLLCCDGAG